MQEFIEINHKYYNVNQIKSIINTEGLWYDIVIGKKEFSIHRDHLTIVTLNTILKTDPNI